MSILDHLTVIEETHSDINQKHNLIDVMFLIITAISSGCEGWQDIEIYGDEKLSWLRQYRAFKHGIPRRHTIARILRSVVAESLFRRFVMNILRQCECGAQVSVAKSKKRAGVMIIGREYFLDYKLIKVCSRPAEVVGVQLI